MYRDNTSDSKSEVSRTCNLQKSICFFFFIFFSFLFFLSSPLSSSVSFHPCASLSSIARHLRFPARGGFLLHHALTRYLRFKLPSHTAIPQSSSSFLLHFYSQWGSPTQPSLSSSSSPVSEQPHWEHRSSSTTNPPMERPRGVQATSRRSTWPRYGLEDSKI